MKLECPHNVTPAEGAFAAPIGLCRCCGYRFPYVDSEMWTKHRIETVTNDRTLCPQCGGKATHTVVERP